MNTHTHNISYKHFPSLEGERRMAWRVNTPEPVSDEDEKKGENAKKKEEKTKASPAIPEQTAAPKVPEATKSRDLPAIWNISRNFVRPKLFRTLALTAALAFPGVGLTAVATDFAARNTIGRIPVAKEVYEKPRNAIVGIANWTSDRIADTLTFPTSAIDRVEDLYEGITGKKQKEAKGPIGETMEWATEKVGDVINAITTASAYVGKGIAKIFKGIKLENVLNAPGKIVDAYAKAWKDHLWLTAAGHVLAAGMFSTYGFAGSGLQIWNVIQHIGNNFGTWLGGVPPPVVP